MKQKQTMRLKTAMRQNLSELDALMLIREVMRRKGFKIAGEAMRWLSTGNEPPQICALMPKS